MAGNGPDFKTDRELRNLLSEILGNCGKTRQQVCDELNALLGQNITVYMLNDWTSAAKKPARFPACFVEAFCTVTGSDGLQRQVMGERLRKLLEFGEMQFRLGKLRTEIEGDNVSR